VHGGGDHPARAGVLAGALCDAAAVGRPWLSPDELLLEDTDFEYRYSKDTDGLEDDPVMQAALSLEVPPLSDWFTPFNTSRLVHPYAETLLAAHRVHDLHQRLIGDDEPSAVLVPEAVDAAAPVGSFAADSEAVTLASRRGDCEDACQSRANKLGLRDRTQASSPPTSQDWSYHAPASRDSSGESRPRTAVGCLTLHIPQQA
jgi:hypothetical protein